MSLAGSGALVLPLDPCALAVANNSRSRAASPSVAAPPPRDIRVTERLQKAPTWSRLQVAAGEWFLQSIFRITKAAQN